MTYVHKICTADKRLPRCRYRFVGVIENPIKEENIFLEARQGEVVEYLTALKNCEVSFRLVHRRAVWQIGGT